MEEDGEMIENTLIDTPIVSTASWRQAGILVVDGSPSMDDAVDAPDFNGRKGDAAGLAISDLLSRFKVSRKAANFSFAGVVFADRVTHVWGPVAGPQVDAAGDYNPLRHTGNGTSLAAGLEKAHTMTSNFLGDTVDGLPSSVVVLLLTDGECGAPDRTRRIAAQLKADPRVTLACAFFATKVPGFEPPAGWLPDDSWPQPPEGWQFWQPVGAADDAGARTSHHKLWIGIAVGALVLVAVLLIALASGGSGKTHKASKTPPRPATLDAATMDQTMGRWLAARYIASLSVNCPSDLPAIAGTSFVCPVIYQGQRWGGGFMEGTVLNSQGQVTFELTQ